MMRASTPDTRFAEVFAVSNDALLLVRRLDWQITEANQAACLLYGYQHDHLVALSFHQLVTEARLATELFEQRRNHVPLRFHCHANGSRFPVQIAARWFMHDSIEYGILSILDLSEKTAREQQQRDAERKYRGIFEAAPYPIYLVNSRGILIDVNTAALSLYGYVRELFIGAPVQQLLAEPQQAGRYYLSRQTFIAGQKHLRHNGESFFADVTLSVTRMRGETLSIVVIRDVSEERAMLELLCRSEERWRFALEGHGDGLWDLALPSRSFYVSRRFRETLGFAATEGENSLTFWNERIHLEDFPIARQALHLHTAGQTELYDIQCRVRGKNEQYLWLNIRGKVMDYDAMGNPSRIIGSIRNIDAQKLAEQRERQQHEQLLHTSRLVSMGEMASALAHELNQPLTAIRNFSSVALRKLSRQGAGDPDILKALNFVTSEAMRAGEIVRHIRDFVRKSETTAHPVALPPIITQVIRLSRLHNPGSPVTIITQLPQDLPLVLADRIQLEQLLLNLIRNAQEAMSGNTGLRQLLIRARQKKHITELHRRTSDATLPETETPCVQVSISDSGHGLSPEALQRLFTPFCSSKPSGLGIGLNICRSIIENHHGHLWAENNPEGGATFHFTLPIAPEPLAPAAHLPAQAAPDKEPPND
jgi:PAS domain S-box-containing protein